MTIVCAYDDPDHGIWVGADRRTNYGDGLCLSLSDKWIRLSESGPALALAGVNRLKMLIRRSLDDAAWEDPYSAAEKMLALVRADDWIPRKNDGDPECYDVQALWAKPGKGVYLISGDLSVDAIPPLTLAAAGSGWAYALGAAHALSSLAIRDGRLIVSSCVLAAIAHNTQCGGEPFVTLIPPY